MTTAACPATIDAMGENTEGPARALGIAKNVLSRDLVRPRMQALAALAKAADVATKPERIRDEAHRAADDLIDEAQRKGQDLLTTARQRVRELRADAARRAKDMRAQAERDIDAAMQRWRIAYQAARDAGWTAEQLAEAEQPAPPARSTRRTGRRRRTEGAAGLTQRPGASKARAAEPPVRTAGATGVPPSRTA